jgi:Uma2 family endonuclease
MSTRTLIAPEEYERMSFDGLTPDYVEGELVERALPTYPHSRTQVRIGGVFEALQKRHRCFGCSELRLRVSASRYYIADVCVFLGDPPVSPYPVAPPQIVIEIISPDERVSELLRKLEDYESWGVKHVWAVEPERGKLYLFTAGALTPASRWQIPEIGVEITPEQVLPESAG